MHPETPHDDEIAYAGVVGQRQLLRDGALTSAQLLELCLGRIERLDPHLRAFRTLLTESARAEAARADDALAAGDERPLLGVPVAIKDNIAVAGQVATLGTASPEPVADADGEIVVRLRAAGAVIVGITTMPELALWPFTESPTFGITRNPWDPSRTPGGSSGGSAAAVASGMVAAAHASDGGGSIRIPAACCHLVGLKPTAGLVPAPVHWEGLSSHGMLTRRVEDTVLLHEVLTSRPVDLKLPGGLRIAWSTRGATPTTLTPGPRGALQGTLEVLRGLGHAVLEADPDLSGVQEAFLARYAAGVLEDTQALADASVLESRTRAVGALAARAPEAVLHRSHRLSARAAARLAHLPGDADVLVTPTVPNPAQPVGTYAGRRTLLTVGRQTAYTVPWNVTGQPALAVPAGLDSNGLPLSVQLVGRPGEEALLLALAAQLQERTGFAAHRPSLTWSRR